MESINWSIIYGVFSLLAGFISLSIAIYLSPYWKNKSAKVLLLLAVSTAVWSFAYGMEFLSPSLILKLWWVKIEYLGAVWVGMLLFSFIVIISGKKWFVTKTGYFFLSIIPIITIILAWTNDYHHLIWSSAWLELSGRTSAIVFKRASGFWGFIVYSYLMLLIASVVLIHSLVSARGRVKKQLIAVLIGILFPWFSNLAYLFGSAQFRLLDLTPISFTISGIAFFWGLLRYQMLSIIPLAREAVLDSMNDPIIAMDMNDRILDINKSAQTLFKLDSITPTYKKLNKILPELYEKVIKCRLLKPAKVETTLVIDTVIKHWMLRLSPLLNKREKQIGWLAILRDITDEKNAKKSIKESGRIHKIMLEASPNPIVYYNEIGEVTYINPAFTRVFGWNLDELLGKRIDFVPEENLEETKSALQRTFDNPAGNYDFITRRHTKNNDILDVSINSTMYHSTDGTSSNMVVNITDITKLKRIEYELRNTKNFIRSIINSMPSILIGLDINSIITQWNSEAEYFTGILAEKAEGSLLKDIFPLLTIHISDVKQILEEQKIKKESKIVLAMGNKKILTDITIYPIQSDSIQGVVLRIDEISERVKIEEMMVQSEKMLSIGGLAAGMAHEINNPLAGVLQNTQVIKNRLSKDLPPNITTAQECGINFEDIKIYMEKRKILPMIENIISSGKQAAEIVSNMLSFSRKSGRRKSSHHLSDIVKTTIELAKSDYNMKKKYDFQSIEIIQEFKENIPPISCEKNELQQVVLNILKNGAEAMTDAAVSSPKFSIRLSRQKNQAILEIEDNGPGIDRETQKRIFEPFFTTKDVGIGTGLGLSISYFIITENHNGVLSVESTLKKGATFKITLPINPKKEMS